MLWAVWIGLAVGTLAVAFGVYRAVRGFVGALRAVRDLQKGTLGALESLARSAERLANHPDLSPRLEPALARFNRSRAQLAMLLAAVGDVRDSIGRVMSVYPRK
jgi:hypothetical protein